MGLVESSRVKQYGFFLQLLSASLVLLGLGFNDQLRSIDNSFYHGHSAVIVIMALPAIFMYGLYLNPSILASIISVILPPIAYLSAWQFIAEGLFGGELIVPSMEAMLLQLSGIPILVCTILGFSLKNAQNPTRKISFKNCLLIYVVILLLFLAIDVLMAVLHYKKIDIDPWSPWYKVLYLR